MRSDHQLEQLRNSIQRTVDDQIKVGAPKVPTTVLERHAFELGRLSILKWMLPEPPADPPTGAPV